LAVEELITTFATGSESLVKCRLLSDTGRRTEKKNSTTEMEQHRIGIRKIIISFLWDFQFGGYKY